MEIDNSLVKLNISDIKKKFKVWKGMNLVIFVDSDVVIKYVVHAVSDGKLCPCGHIHKPRYDGRGLRTYCVEGSKCNSDKCDTYVATGEGDGK